MKAGNAAAGTGFVAAARAIEGQLPEPPLNAAGLYRTEAQIAALGGAAPEVILRTFIRGASRWYQWFQKPLGVQEVAAVAAALHEHFLILARRLHAAGRSAEALLSFEAGRALGFTMEVDDAFFTDVLQENPFAEDGEGIDLAILNQTRAGIPAGEVFVSLAELPDVLAGFVVSRRGASGFRPTARGRGGGGSAKGTTATDPPGPGGEQPHPRAPGTGSGTGRTARPGDREPDRHRPCAVRLASPGAVAALLHHFGLPWERMPYVTGFGLFASPPTLSTSPHARSGPWGTGTQGTEERSTCGTKRSTSPPRSLPATSSTRAPRRGFRPPLRRT